MTAPAVSIIMNCLNGEKDLGAALSSARAQTMRDFEIIFWDNASTDRSAEIARSFGPELRFFRGEKTVPLGAARNLAIREAKGDFIAFLDCDDLWRPEKLSSQLELFGKKPGLGLVCTDTAVFDGKKVLSRLFDGAKPQRGWAFAALVQSQWISMSSAMVSRRALDSVAPAPGEWFDESLNVCEEADLFYRIAHDFEIDHVDEALTLWRVHERNTTFRKFAQFAAETEKILEKHIRLYPGYEREHPELAALLRDRARFQKAVALWREGQGAEARKLIAQMSSKSPKTALFSLASRLPGSFFDLGARIYFSLPRFLRK